MPSRVKCVHCLGCMSARWVENKRYYYCDLCKVWYGGGSELIEVESPYINYNKPIELKEQEDEK